MSATLPSAALPLPSDKIRTRHRDRNAVVYVRQSTVRQVRQHQESTRLQYALAERALQLGWARQRVEVIDDDLGRSGCVFRRIPAGQSDAIQPVIPAEASHPFRGNPATSE